MTARPYTMQRKIITFHKHSHLTIESHTAEHVREVRVRRNSATIYSLQCSAIELVVQTIGTINYFTCIPTCLCSDARVKNSSAQYYSIANFPFFYRSHQLKYSSNTVHGVQFCIIIRSYSIRLHAIRKRLRVIQRQSIRTTTIRVLL